MSIKLTGRFVPPPVANGYVLQTIGDTPTWVPASQAFTQVDFYADLPPAADHYSEIYYVRNGSGVWLINRKSPGFYRSNGIIWEYGGELIEAFDSDNFRVYDGANSAYSFKFDTSNITSGSPIVVTVPNYDVTLGLTSEYGLNANIVCDSGVAVGDWVYMDGSSVAQKAIATSEIASFARGVVLSKPSPTTANIIITGVTPAIFTGLIPGKEYFLSETTAGSHVVAGVGIPSGAGSYLFVLGTAISATEMQLKLTLRGRRS